jgi:hypothetical protein
MWHVYVRSGTAFVPDVAQTQAGFFLDVDPVRVADLDDFESLSSAIEEAMRAGNPRVPTPTRSAFPKPVILKPAGVKSWNAFVERGACFTIFRDNEGLEITETARNEAGEWVDAPALSWRLSPSSPASELARRIVERAAQREDLT